MRKISKIKNTFLGTVFLLSISGCTFLTEAQSFKYDFTTSVNPNNIPNEVEEAAKKYIDADEIYGIGVGFFSKGGSLVADYRADELALEKLELQIRMQILSQLRSYADSLDAYSEKIYSPVVPSLVDLISKKMLLKVKRESSWDLGDRTFALFTISKKAISEEVKKNFELFIDEVSSNLKSSRGKISK